jgi:hypothetical protein
MMIQRSHKRPSRTVALRVTIRLRYRRGTRDQHRPFTAGGSPCGTMRRV